MISLYHTQTTFVEMSNFHDLLAKYKRTKSESTLSITRKDAKESNDKESKFHCNIESIRYYKLKIFIVQYIISFL